MSLKFRLPPAAPFRAVLGIAAALAVGAAVMPGSLEAQRRRPEAPRFIDAGNPDGSGNILLDTMRLGFRLFGNGDEAVTGMRATGALGTYMSNLGPCDHNQTFGNCHYRRPTFRFAFFEIPLMSGAPPGDFAKVRAVNPNAGRNVRGGGWTTIANGSQTGFGTNFQNGPADESLGKLFSGATSTDNGACTDNSTDANGFVDPGIQLLAGSDCPDTHAPSGFAGPRRISFESWNRIFAAYEAGQKDLARFDSAGRSGAAGFQWNEWQVPDSLKDLSKYLGGFSTYGAITDYHSTIRPLYGAVVPGQSGQASVDGWPIGLRWEFQAYTFAIPAVSSVVFWRALVINRSEDVYGVGIDYDSLYAGVEPGTGNSGGGQAHSNYYLPQFSAGLYHQSNNTQGLNCGASRVPAGVSGCQGTLANGGYRTGADWIVFLKSPLGDLRNKLYTRRPGSGWTGPLAACIPGTDPFCFPGHPDAGDTITVNHGHMCGFGGCWATGLNVSDKRAFGLLSSQEEVARDGRTLTPSTESWRTFRNFAYPSVHGVYNKYVPGVDGPPAAVWDWNDDGIPDTLSFDSCHRNGCVASSQDTMPGGQVNAYGNIGGLLAAGPFKLAAGDTTEFLIAFIGENDSVRAWSAMDQATIFYQTFYLGPEAPPPSTIVATSVTAPIDSVGVFQTPRAQILFDDAPQEWEDPFLAKVADDMEAAPPGSDLAFLRDNNPGLVDELRTRAADNVEQLEIYKSCDGGTSFTADNDCIGDPASLVDGNPDALGWRAYAILRTDDFAGDLPNTFSDANVIGGARYLYTIVAKTRGATYILNTPTGPDSVQFAPSVRNVLSSSTSDVNVVSIYVPASRQSGGHEARAAFQPRPEKSTAPFRVVFSDTATSGRYDAIFGNEVVVDEYRTGSTLDRSVVIVRTRVNADVGGVSTPTVISETQFERVGDEPIALAGTPVVSNPSATITRRTLSGLGFVLARGTEPLFGSNALTGTAATPAQLFGQSQFPGFGVEVVNLLPTGSNAWAFVNERTVAISASAKRRLAPETDTVDIARVPEQIAHWRSGLARRVVTADANVTARGGAGGEYLLTWADEPFGLPNGLNGIDPTNPLATQDELRTALAARTVADTGLTDAATATLVTNALVGTGLLPAGSTTVTLAPIRLPFSIQNLSQSRPVRVAMVVRTDSSYRLGTGADTVRVFVPGDQWVAGDLLVFIEDVLTDQPGTVPGTIVLGPNGQPVQVTQTQVTYARAVVGCADGTTPGACNPVRPGARGATTYNPALDNGDQLVFRYDIPYTIEERVAFDVSPPLRGTAITSVTAADLARIHVVPNPFIVFSQYQASLPGTSVNTAIENSRVLFTSVPPSGTIRIYTVAGQFVQQITWTADDLNGNGDLFYNLRTREGTDIASGLYIWVLTTSAELGSQVARGKFVVIRGTTR